MQAYEVLTYASEPDRSGVDATVVRYACIAVYQDKVKDRYTSIIKHRNKGGVSTLKKEVYLRASQIYTDGIQSGYRMYSTVQ